MWVCVHSGSPRCSRGRGKHHSATSHPANVHYWLTAWLNPQSRSSFKWKVTGEEAGNLATLCQSERRDRWSKWAMGVSNSSRYSCTSILSWQPYYPIRWMTKCVSTSADRLSECTAVFKLGCNTLLQFFVVVDERHHKRAIAACHLTINYHFQWRPLLEQHITNEDWWCCCLSYGSA